MGSPIYVIGSIKYSKYAYNNFVLIKMVPLKTCYTFRGISLCWTKNLCYKILTKYH